MPVKYEDKRAVCPYFQYSKSLQSFVCEAFFRPGVTTMWFENAAAKRGYMDAHCCSMQGWKECNYALVLNTIYDYEED